MTSPMTRHFNLVPYFGPNEPSPSAASFFPAIPVAIKGAVESIVYAPLDVSLPVSTVTTRYLKEIGIPPVRDNTAGSPLGVIMVHLTVELLDEDLERWLLFERVPFSVLSPESVGDETPSVTIGFRSCLSKLRVSIDFRKKSMSINAPKRFVVPRSDRPQVSMPSSIDQAEELIDLGSYNSGIVLIVSGLEEALLVSLTPSSQISSYTLLSETLREATGDNSLQNDLEQIYELRNIVVHGKSASEVTEQEARRILAVAKRMIRRVNQST